MVWGLTLVEKNSPTCKKGKSSFRNIYWGYLTVWTLQIPQKYCTFCEYFGSYSEEKNGCYTDLVQFPLGILFSWMWLSKRVLRFPAGSLSGCSPDQFVTLSTQTQSKKPGEMNASLCKLWQRFAQEVNWCNTNEGLSFQRCYPKG